MELPSDSAVISLAEQYASLCEGLDDSGEKPLLVLPNGEFFPDVFRGDEASVGLLVARMQGYAGLEDVEVDVRIVGELEAKSGGCGSGACSVPSAKPGETVARVVQEPGRFVMQVPAAELGHPIVLTSRLATSLGAIYLLERHPEGAELVQDAAVSELMALELGFSVLLLEASYLYAKSCGGPSVQRATALGAGELAVVFSLWLARHEHTPKKALAELGTTQKALVKQALSLLDESPGLARALKTDLSRVARGRFKLREGRSFFARWFGSKSEPQDTQESRENRALAALERGASVDELADLLGDAPKERAAKKARSEADEDLTKAVDEALHELRRDSARERA